MKNAYKTIALIAGAMLLVSFLLPVIKTNVAEAFVGMPHTIFSDGFESGDFSNWDIFNTKWTVSNRTATTYKAEVTNNTDPGNDILRKEVQTVGYENLVVDYEYRIITSKDLEITDHVYVEWGDASISPITWNVLADYTNVAQDSWTSALFNLPTNANNLTNLRLRFRADLNGGDDSFRLDNVSITGNCAPTASDDSAVINEDSTINITLTATDLNGDPIDYSIVSEPSNGTVVLVGNIATYTPNSNYSGLDSFTFKVNDGQVDSNIATVSLTIDPVADIPVADNLAITIYKNTPTWFDITGSDGDGDPLTYTIIDQPTVGHISDTAPHIKYTSGLDALGADSFTFRVNDGANDSATIATVSITVVEVPVGGGCGGQCQSGSSGEVLGISIEATPTPSPIIEPESTPIPTPAPEVLGETTTCGELINNYLWFGGNNNSEQVKLLQQFLNDNMSSGLPTTGYYGPLTKGAVKSFQEKYADKILQPWIDKGLMTERIGSGNVYKTTKWWINMTVCPSLNLPQPMIP